MTLIFSKRIEREEEYKDWLEKESDRLILIGVITPLQRLRVGFSTLVLWLTRAEKGRSFLRELYLELEEGEKKEVGQKGSPVIEKEGGFGGYFYLHANGDLIWKRFRPEPSPFVRRIWAVSSGDPRTNAWLIAVEALALGAPKERIFELKEKWGLSDDEAQEFAKKFDLRLYLDGDQWCATRNDFVNLQESDAGFGPTALEALSELVKALLKEGLGFPVAGR